jgi:hypothetical protein
MYERFHRNLGFDLPIRKNGSRRIFPPNLCKRLMYFQLRFLTLMQKCWMRLSPIAGAVSTAENRQRIRATAAPHGETAAIGPCSILFAE